MVTLSCVLRLPERIKISSKYVRRKFIDSLRLHVKAGAGGMGYPKYGGIGGPGGDVFVVGKKGLTLKDVIAKHPDKRVVAGTGGNSHKNRILGEKGSDVKVEVPVGISVYDEAGSKLGEINSSGEEVLVGKGGVGGCKATGHSGLKGQTHVVTLDLKLIADVGLVGFPNAGKSTILSVISNAKPKIASYPFTTLKPDLGLIEYPDLRRISVADLPGLIEGAHANIGMGHKFLKHVERTKLLLVVVDIGGFKLSHKYASRSCLETIVLLNKELELYREDLIDRPAILVINKMDKKNSKESAEMISEAVADMEGVFEEVPERIRPIKPLSFHRVVRMSAKDKDPFEIEELKRHIREVLDLCVTEETEESETELVELIRRRTEVRGPIAI